MEISTLTQSINVNSVKQSKFVLFIDDNPLVLETVKQLLDKSSLELLLIDDSYEGLCCVVENKPAAIFIDSNMASLTGYQFCALVKAQKQYQYIPLIVVMELDNKLEQAKAYAAGANAVLIKPFGENELLKLCAAPGAKVA